MSSDPFSPAINSLRQLKTKFVIVGGIAVAQYLPGRFTEDLDILISVEDADSMRNELRQIGATAIRSLSIGGHTFRLSSGLELDVLESSAAWTQCALDHPTTVSAGWPVIGVPFLVLMKLDAGRERDLRDIALIVGSFADEQFTVIRNTVLQFLPDAVDDLISLRELGALELGSQSDQTEVRSAPRQEDP